MIVQAVADVIQAQEMGQMGVQHGDHMDVGAEGTHLDLVLAGKVLVFLSGTRLAIWARTVIVCFCGFMASPLVAW